MSAASILPTVAQGLELQVLNAWETTESRKLMAQVLNDLDARIPPGIRG